MAGVKGLKKRRKSTVEEDDISSPAEQQPSPSKRLRSEKKEQKADIKTPSPTKERKPKSSKDQTSNPKKTPKDKSPSKGKDSKGKRVRTPSPIGQPASSPLRTPKTPRGASKLGIPVDAAKTMLNYASRLDPFVGMIYAVTQYFTESKEDMLSREDFLPKLVDCVNSLDTVLLDKKSFSALNQEEIASMWSSNNLVAKGNIKFGSSKELLGDTKLPASFIQQLDTVYGVNVDAVTEAGCRMAIGLFLVNAVSIAKEKTKKPLALFSEVTFECPDLRGIGPISGSLDYVSSIVINTTLPVSETVFPQHGPPYFLVVEDKTSTTIGREGSRGQLMAQLLTLDYHDPAPDGRAGCLTDGKRWDFVYLKPALVRKVSRDLEEDVEGYEVYETRDLGAKKKEEIKKIMGILVHFVSKFSPHDTDVISLQETSVVQNTDDEEEEWRGLQYIGGE